MSIPFETYYDRLKQLCEDAIADSIATEDPFMGSSSFPFWVINFLDTAESQRGGRDRRMYQISAELILVRGGADGGVGGTLYGQLLADYSAVLHYFFVHQNMRRTTGDAQIDFFVPGSVRIRGTGTGLLQVTQATGQGLVARGVRGTRYQISWEHLDKLTVPIV